MRPERLRPRVLDQWRSRSGVLWLVMKIDQTSGVVDVFPMNLDPPDGQFYKTTIRQLLKHARLRTRLGLDVRKYPEVLEYE
jgi:hypothetical protein